MTLNNVPQFQHLNESIWFNVEKVRFSVHVVPVLMSFNFNFRTKRFNVKTINMILLFTLFERRAVHSRQIFHLQ